MNIGRPIIICIIVFSFIVQRVLRSHCYNGALEEFIVFCCAVVIFFNSLIIVSNV